MATADRQNKKAKILKESGQYEQALQMMPPLESFLKQNPDYWGNYGEILFEKQQYQAALTCFEKAKTRSSLPEIYIRTGMCYEKLQQYPKAITEYETLVALYPSKFLYRMMLLENYLKNKEVHKAIVLAQEIIELKPRIPSDKVERYKRMCRGLLSKLKNLTPALSKGEGAETRKLK
jgi:tetratricopeptide (TPR) repeat protein